MWSLDSIEIKEKKNSIENQKIIQNTWNVTAEFDAYIFNAIYV